MKKQDIEKEYFEWIYDKVCGERFAKEISYRHLLTQLHDTKFICVIPNDRNRVEDGVCLRNRFGDTIGIDDIHEVLSDPCSVLEMILALAIRMEETIMDDPRYGDRTCQWFWSMIQTLGLKPMIDSRYDQDVVSEILSNFLYRKYSPDGKGGLFYIRNCKDDLTKVEIWHQMCCYINKII